MREVKLNPAVARRFQELLEKPFGPVKKLTQERIDAMTRTTQREEALKIPHCGPPNDG